MCVIFIAWLGKMARNSHSIARHFNTAMESIGRAVRPKSQSLWVYISEWQPVNERRCIFKNMSEGSPAKLVNTRSDRVTHVNVCCVFMFVILDVWL